MKQNFQKIADLSPGLYLVATPLGSARDITLRALDILASADVIVAEDTRTARKLMALHDVPLGERKLIAFHDHSGPSAAEGVINFIGEGRSVAYLSEAGTPGISDPGYELVRAATEHGHAVHAAPGPVAAIAALIISGLPTDRFTFFGFPPPQQARREAFLAEVQNDPGTLIFYESPRRVHEFLKSVSDVLGSERPVALCRELTKTFEEVRRGSVAEVLETVQADPPRGEIVVLIGAGQAGVSNEDDVRKALIEAMKTMRVKDAATSVAGAYGLPKREVYQLALSLNAE